MAITQFSQGKPVFVPEVGGLRSIPAPPDLLPRGLKDLAWIWHYHVRPEMPSPMRMWVPGWNHAPSEGHFYWCFETPYYYKGLDVYLDVINTSITRGGNQVYPVYIAPLDLSPYVDALWVRPADSLWHDGTQRLYITQGDYWHAAITLRILTNPVYPDMVVVMHQDDTQAYLCERMFENVYRYLAIISVLSIDDNNQRWCRFRVTNHEVLNLHKDPKISWHGTFPLVYDLRGADYPASTLNRMTMYPDAGSIY